MYKEIKENLILISNFRIKIIIVFFLKNQSNAEGKFCYMLCLFESLPSFDDYPEIFYCQLLLLGSSFQVILVNQKAVSEEPVEELFFTFYFFHTLHIFPNLRIVYSLNNYIIKKYYTKASNLGPHFFLFCSFIGATHGSFQIFFDISIPHLVIILHSD